MNRLAVADPSKTVLLLEDDPDFAAVAATALRETALQVLVALHPWDAFRHLDGEQPIDLFLTDLRMPRGTPHGFAMARMAKRRHPAAKVLYLTAYRHLAGAENDPLGKILYKPVGPELLVREVHRALAAG